MRSILAALLLSPLLGQDSEIQKLIKMLGSSSFEEQGKAAAALEGLGILALPDLEKAAAGGDGQIRDWAVKIKARIEKIGQKQKDNAWKNRYPTRVRAPDPPVRQALLWLARHQGGSGGWGGRTFNGACSGAKCSGAVEADFDIGLTGLALLALMGAGFGPFSQELCADPVTGNEVSPGEAVHRGLQFLMERQDQAGCLGERGMKFQYNHMIAAMALCEAYGMTGSAVLKEPAQKAVEFTVAAQNPGKGWRYHPRSGDSDTSVTGWAVMGLNAAELAGLAVPKDSFAAALKWLNDVTEQKDPYHVGYNAKSTGKVFVPGRNEQFDHHATMTAIGLVMRLLIQKRKGDPELAGIRLLMNDLPEWKANKIDLYYWYWGSLAMHQVDGPQGAQGKKWSDAARTALAGQRTAKDGCLSGSWDSEQERWGFEGGRVYSTALAAMILQTPHRFAPVASEAAPRKK